MHYMRYWDSALFAKRLFDFLMSFLGLLLLSPLFFLVAILIKIDSPGPIFFRQERIGQYGKPFRIHKFRSMFFIGSEAKGSLITIGADSRITRVGVYIRKYKIDELAQLFDVLIGTMSLVGPRPEVSRYVDYYPKEVKETIFSVRPGITDRASIEFKDESLILGKSSDPHQAYVKDILPIKIQYYVRYVNGRSFFGDLHILFKTLKALIVD